MPKTVKKAVIPAAGLGTRLRPLTHSMPKELLPVGNKPIIQHTLEMYIASGIFKFCIITSPKKSLLKDFVAGSWKPSALPYSRDTGFYQKLKACRTDFITQDEPRGIADAVALARDFVGNDPFACIMPDSLLFSERPLAMQLIEAFQRYQTDVIGTVFILGSDAECFGNVGVLETKALDDRHFAITSLSDKTQAPLVMKKDATIHKGFGGGIYFPEYFELIEAIRDQVQGELDDVPIHQILVKRGSLIGLLLEGVAFDVGHPLGFRAAVHYVGRRAKRPQDAIEPRTAFRGQ